MPAPPSVTEIALIASISSLLDFSHSAQVCSLTVTPILWVKLSMRCREGNST
jgi:hypothetical protein